MRKERTVYSWDTCVFLAHFKQEQDKNLDDIAAVLDEILTGKADLVLSITIRMEILDVVESPQLRSDLTEFLKRSNIMVVNVDPPVADQVISIRYAAHNGDPSRNVKTPDAQIIATAMLYGADVLHSYDEKVLNLSGSDIVGGLKIVKPCLINGQRLLPAASEDATQDAADTQPTASATVVSSEPRS